MFCMFCGKPLPDNAIYCCYCGKKQNDNTVSTPSGAGSDFSDLEAFFSRAVTDQRAREAEERERIEAMFDIQSGVLAKFNNPDPTADEVVIPDSVTSIGLGAFAGCRNLKKIVMPNSVQSMDAFAFANCTALTDIIIPDSVTSIDGCAFTGCTALTSITIPDSVTSIGSMAFCECAQLRSVILPRHTQVADDAFIGCPATVIRR